MGKRKKRNKYAEFSKAKKAYWKDHARNSTCRRKVRHKSRGAALKVKEATGHDVEPYYCNVCQGYHLRSV